MENDKNPFPKLELIPGLGYIKRLGENIIRYVYFTPPETESPLDTPIEPVTDFPGQQMFDMGSLDD